MLSNLYASLARASEHFSGDATFDPKDEGFEATLKIQQPMPDAARKFAGAYIKQYALESGWRMRVKFEKGYVRLAGSPAKAASKPSSKSSQKRSAHLCGSSK